MVVGVILGMIPHVWCVSGLVGPYIAPGFPISRFICRLFMNVVTCYIGRACGQIPFPLSCLHVHLPLPHP